MSDPQPLATVERLDRDAVLAELGSLRAALLEESRHMLRGRVAAAWIYGSFWGTHFGPQSDVDIAVAGLQGDRFELAADLSAALEREVDVIEIDHSDPIIGFQVLAHGLRILDDRGLGDRIEGDVLAMYLDWKVTRRPIELSHAHGTISLQVESLP